MEILKAAQIRLLERLQWSDDWYWFSILYGELVLEKYSESCLGTHLRTPCVWRAVWKQSQDVRNSKGLGPAWDELEAPFKILYVCVSIAVLEKDRVGQIE